MRTFIGKRIPRSGSCVKSVSGSGLLLQKGLGTTIDAFPDEEPAKVMVPVAPRATKKSTKKKKFILKF